MPGIPTKKDDDGAGTPVAPSATHGGCRAMGVKKPRPSPTSVQHVAHGAGSVSAAGAGGVTGCPIHAKTRETIAPRRVSASHGQSGRHGAGSLLAV